MQKLIEDYGIDETLTKPGKPGKQKRKKYNRIKDNIPLKEDYNMMMDVLHLPTDTNGFKYLLVVVDLASDEFDMEQMKEEDSEHTLKALNKIFARKFLDIPFAV
jgi:hypothetical protein